MTEVEPSDLVPGTRYHIIKYYKVIQTKYDAEYVGPNPNGDCLYFNRNGTMITLCDDMFPYYTFQDLDVGPILKGGRRRKRKSRKRFN